jgi:hypothetical protein
MYSRTDIQRVKIFLTPATQTNQLSSESLESIIMQLNNGLQATPEEKEPEEFLTKEEVMRLCHIHRQTYYSWLRRGWLKPLGKGRKALFRKSEVLKRQA